MFCLDYAKLRILFTSSHFQIFKFCMLCSAFAKWRIQPFILDLPFWLRHYREEVLFSRNISLLRSF